MYNIWVKLDYLKYIFIIYDYSLKYLNEYARLLQSQKIQVSIIYNKSLLSYFIGNNKNYQK